MIEQQFLGSLADFGLGVLPLPATRDDGASLQGGGSAVEDEDRLRPEEQKLANPTEET